MGLGIGRPFQHRMDRADMAQITQEFVQAAILCTEAGFDAVEIHMGHGYLLNQFISPLSNHRRDSYGGSANNRVRFPAEVTAAVKAAVGDRLAIIAKINLHDGVKKGATVDDAIVTAKALERAGVDMLVSYASRTVSTIAMEGWQVESGCERCGWKSRLYGPQMSQRVSGRPSSGRGIAVKQAGADADEVRSGDYNRPETLAAAYAGLDRLLIIPTLDLEYGARARQLVAAIDAACAAGVGQIVLISDVSTREEEEPVIGAASWIGEQHLIHTAPSWVILRANELFAGLVRFYRRRRRDPCGDRQS